MTRSRVEIVEENLDRYLREAVAVPALLARAAPIRPGSDLTAGQAV